MSAGARRQPTEAGRGLVAELEYGRHAALVQRRVDGYVGRHRLAEGLNLTAGRRTLEVGLGSGEEVTDGEEAPARVRETVQGGRQVGQGRA